MFNTNIVKLKKKLFSGKLEVKQLVSKLRKAFPYRETDSKISVNTKCKPEIKKEIGKLLPEINLDDYDIEMHSEDELILSDNSSADEDDDDEVPSKIMKFSSSPLWVLPLYSMLPAHKQSKVNLLFDYCIKKTLDHSKIIFLIFLDI